MSMSKKSKASVKHGKETMSTLGLKLFDVIPCAFPDHVLIKRLQKERNAWRQAFLVRFYRDHDPQALKRAIDEVNRTFNKCSCPDCHLKAAPPLVVRTWDKLKWLMIECGLSFAVVLSEEELKLAAARFKACISFNATRETERAPEGFDGLTACPFMAPVSHLDVHIVVICFRDSLGITYGRKLWGIQDIVSSEDIAKLELLFARLRDSVSQAL